jgi:hypothetical protein
MGKNAKHAEWQARAVKNTIQKAKDKHKPRKSK